jgi:hypothetical protein
MGTQEITITNSQVPRGTLKIAETLPSPDSVPPGTEIVLRFVRGEFVNLASLVMLATWRKSLPAEVIT